MSETVHRLPGVVPPPEPPERPAQSFSFRFARRSGWIVWLHHEDASGQAMRNLSCYGVPPAPTRVDARDRARAYAEANGIPYAEWTPPPPLTPAEETQRTRGSLYAMIRWADDRAKEHEAKNEWQRAAESWMRAAARCEEAITVSPGLAQHFITAATSRLERAASALDEWGERLASMPATAGLTVLEPGSEPGGDRP